MPPAVHPDVAKYGKKLVAQGFTPLPPDEGGNPRYRSPISEVVLTLPRDGSDVRRAVADFQAAVAAAAAPPLSEFEKRVIKRDRDFRFYKRLMSETPAPGRVD